MRSSAVAAFAALVSNVVGQQCISLTGSTECPAFSTAQFTTDSSVYSAFGVTNVSTFDTTLRQYLSSEYIHDQYLNRLGCQGVNGGNTTNFYASQFATSEEEIVSDSSVCSSSNSDNDNAEILRSDFTTCALPSSSITTGCIEASANEPLGCGYRSPTGDINLLGFCSYCQASTENATDSCCFTQDAEHLCRNVVLPSIFIPYSSFVMSPTASATSTGSSSSTTATTGTTSSSTSTPAGMHSGLSGGAIAGIVVGVVLGVLLLLGLLVFGCLAYRRRNRDNGSASSLNQPSPPRRTGAIPMSSNSLNTSQRYDPPAAARVTQMQAMQGDEPIPVGQRHYSARELYGDNPASPGILGQIRSPGSHDSSPDSNDVSSPEGVASGQSEQLPFFKDYYSDGDIHPNDKVSVLWAYQPRAGDEFELERGDMLKVVGIWDDGWATGVRIEERAEDYDGKLKAQRDSGVSREESPIGGEIKAFPLVCVCLPDAWKKTVEGDSSTEGGSAGPQI